VWGYALDSLIQVTVQWRLLEHTNKPSDFIKARVFFDHLSDSHLPKGDCVS
jgi:hypothetical protein